MSELKIIERLVDDLVTRVEALEEKSEEIWVPIKDNWNYFISNKGRVKHYQGREPKISVDGRYYRLKLNNVKYRLHRLLAEAFIPNPENKPYVDHIDGDSLNNALANLRWCTREENMRNRKKHRNNTSEYPGVHFRKDIGKYTAYVRDDGKNKHLGCFRTKEEANAAREKAAEELYGEFRRRA